jgi:hypothetical protein
MAISMKNPLSIWRLVLCRIIKIVLKLLFFSFIPHIQTKLENGLIQVCWWKTNFLPILFFGTFIKSIDSLTHSLLRTTAVNAIFKVIFNHSFRGTHSHTRAHTHSPSSFSLLNNAHTDDDDDDDSEMYKFLFSYSWNFFFLYI